MHITYFLGVSRVITVASKYLLAEITICLQRIIQRTIIFCQKANIMNLVLQTILFNTGHSSFFNSMLLQENWPYYELAREQAKECNNPGETEEVCI